MNLRMAVYKGEPVLTWWEGKTKHGLGIGEHVIYDRSYREIARFPSGNGLGADLHELMLTPQGTALVTAWDIQTVDRSSVGHGRGRVIEGVAQELEIPTARVLFEWRSLDHVALTESTHRSRRRSTTSTSTRSTTTATATCSSRAQHLDRLQDRPWQRQGDLAARRQEERLRDGAGRPFAWQHDARSSRQRQHGHVFDNADDPQEQPQSRGLVLGARHQAQARDTRPRSTPTCPRSSRTPSAACRLSRTATSSSAGAPSRTSPSTRRTARSSSTRSSRTAARTTARSAFPGSGRRRDKPALASRGQRCTRAGTARPRSRPGRCSAARARQPGRCRRSRGSASRRRSGSGAAGLRRRRRTRQEREATRDELDDPAVHHVTSAAPWSSLRGSGPHEAPQPARGARQDSRALGTARSCPRDAPREGRRSGRDRDGLAGRGAGRAALVAGARRAGAVRRAFDPEWLLATPPHTGRCGQRPRSSTPARPRGSGTGGCGPTSCATATGWSCRRAGTPSSSWSP